MKSIMKKVEELILELSRHYDGEKGSLDFTTPFELLVAVMLSAQCTDARVNIVTKDLFLLVYKFFTSIFNFIKNFSSILKNIITYLSICFNFRILLIMLKILAIRTYRTDITFRFSSITYFTTMIY